MDEQEYQHELNCAGEAMAQAENDMYEELIRLRKRIKELEAENKSEYKRGLEIGKKMLEDKVIAENQRLREALEEIVDSELRVTHHRKQNKAWCEILGYTEIKEIAQKALEE